MEVSLGYQVLREILRMYRTILMHHSYPGNKMCRCAVPLIGSHDDMDGACTVTG